MIAGGCLCGAVTLSVARHAAEVSACHCSLCLRWSGSPFMGFDAPPEAVTVEGEVKTFASSSFAERAFCPTCGSHLWFRDVAPEPGDYEFPPGLFPAAHEFPLVREVYADRAPRWAGFAGAHPRVTAAEYERDNPFVPGGDLK